MPPVAKLTEFTQTVAQSAIDQGIAGVEDDHKAVADMKWEPKY